MWSFFEVREDCQGLNLQPTAFLSSYVIHFIVTCCDLSWNVHKKSILNRPGKIRERYDIFSEELPFLHERSLINHHVSETPFPECAIAYPTWSSWLGVEWSRYFCIVGIGAWRECGSSAHVRKVFERPTSATTGWTSNALRQRKHMRFFWSTRWVGFRQQVSCLASRWDYKISPMSPNWCLIFYSRWLCNFFFGLGGTPLRSLRQAQHSLFWRCTMFASFQSQKTWATFNLKSFAKNQGKRWGPSPEQCPTRTWRMHIVWLTLKT